MFQDSKGKTGFKNLQGKSGKVYGASSSGVKLYGKKELAVMLKDGIKAYTPSPIVQDAIKVKARAEQQRIQAIKLEARRQIFSRTTGVTDSFEVSVLKEINKLVRGVLILNSVVDKTSLSTSDQSTLASLVQDAQNSVAIRSLSNAAELANDTPAKFRFDIEQQQGKAPTDKYSLKANPKKPGTFIEDTAP